MPGRCWKTLYSRDRKNGMFKMKMIYSSTITGRMEEYDSQLTLGTPRKPSVIKYSIPLTFMEDEFQVLATDYESFAIEYKCDPNGFLEKQESIFLNTREKNPSPLVLQRAYAIMHRLGVDIRKLERVDQTRGGLNLSGPEYPDYDDYYTNEAPSNRRFQTAGQNENSVGDYDYYDYPASGSAAVGVDPSPPSNTQGWVPVAGSPPVQHQASKYDHTMDYHEEEAASASVGGHTQYVEMQPVEHHPQYHQRPPVKQPDPMIELRPRPRPGNNKRPGPGGNRRVSRPQDDDHRISIGQTLATRLWKVLHSPVNK